MLCFMVHNSSPSVSLKKSCNLTYWLNKLFNSLQLFFAGISKPAREQIQVADSDVHVTDLVKPHIGGYRSQR